MLILMIAQQVQQALQKIATPKKAKASAWFFKTAQGQYGHGDKFRGVTVPEQRRVAKKFRDLALVELTQLLQSPWHEDRLTALFILVDQFQHSTLMQQQVIVRYYLQHKKYVNNWDLVDSSADRILGEYLYTTKHSIKRLKVLPNRQCCGIAGLPLLRLTRLLNMVIRNLPYLWLDFYSAIRKT